MCIYIYIYIYIYMRSSRNPVANLLTSKVALHTGFPLQNPVFKSVSPAKTSYQDSSGGS